MLSNPTTRRRASSLTKKSVEENVSWKITLTRLIAVTAFAVLLITISALGVGLFFTANAQSEQGSSVSIPATSEDRDSFQRAAGQNEATSIEPSGNQPNAVAATFMVTRSDDIPERGTCAVGDCTLREAIIAANNNPGPDTITFAAGLNGVPITLTQAATTSEDFAADGDLDVNESVTITGNGAGNTIIRAGASAYGGVDKVFGLNPNCSSAGNAVSVTMTDMTISNGHNTDLFNAQFSHTGGAIDYCPGGSGTNNLTMTNVIVRDSQVTNGTGGGLNISGVGTGTTTIDLTNVQFLNNKTSVSANPNTGAGASITLNTSATSMTVNITNCTFDNNQSASIGGGLVVISNIATGRTGVLNIHNSLFSNNKAHDFGGGIELVGTSGANGVIAATIDQGTVIKNNVTGLGGSSLGGGIHIDLIHPSSFLNISKATIINNSEDSSSNNKLGGAGIAVGNAAGTGAVGGVGVSIQFSRIAGNTLSVGSAGVGTGLRKDNQAGSVNATSNWWGCSAGPAAAPCDTAALVAGSGALTTAPFLRIKTTPTTNPIIANQSSLMTARVQNSSGVDTPVANLDVFVNTNTNASSPLPITWSSVGGTLSGQQSPIQSAGGFAQATATYLGTAALVSNSTTAKIDNDTTTGNTNTGTITVNKGNTAATVGSQSPATTVTGQSYTVNFNAAPTNTTNSPTAMTGNVIVSDGSQSCTGAINSSGIGSCVITSTTAGTKTLTATYQGDSNFNASAASPGVSHTVSKADTTTVVNSDTPDPSVFGQSYTVNATVSVNAPGAGTPTGSIGVSDGTNTCTITLPSPTTCSLPSTSPGAKTITATYNGDANFNASPGATASHTVNQGTTNTAVISSVNPSITGQSVTFTATVGAASPAVGTPTGTVQFIVDGSSFGAPVTLSGGIATTNTSALTAGSHTVSANYGGDTNFVSSSGSLAGGQNVSNTATWNGAASTSWTTAGNWVTGAVPGSTNDVSIPAAGVTNEPTISTAVTLASITEATGRTLTVSSAGNLAVTGACTVNGTANIAGTASCGSVAGTGTVNFTGTAVQNVPGGTYQNLGVTNAAGINLSASVTVNGVLNLGGGDLNTGANVLTIGTTGTVTRTSGAVIGPVQKLFGGPGAFTYPVGTAGAFSPVDANVTAGAGQLTVTAKTGTAPATTPPLVTANTLQRYWDLNGSGITVDVTWHYLQTDVNGTEANYRIIRVVSSGAAISVPNGSPCPGTGSPCVDTTNNTIFAKGLTSFSLWTAGANVVTAAKVAITGRVVRPDGLMAVRSLVSMTDDHGNVRYAKTNPFGYFRFQDVESGQGYVINVIDKQFEFAPQFVSVTDNMGDLVLTLQPRP